MDSDSSADGPEDVEEFEDAPESFIIEDDMFIDNIRSTKIQRLSTFIQNRPKTNEFNNYHKNETMF